MIVDALSNYPIKQTVHPVQRMALHAAEGLERRAAAQADRCIVLPPNVGGIP